jgi:hypothetical protein
MRDGKKIYKRKGVPYLYIFLAFLCFLSLPGFLSNINLAGSHAAGVLLSTIPIVFIAFITRDWMPFTKYEFQTCLCILFIILIHFLLVALVGGLDKYIGSGALSRFNASFILLTIILWAAFQLERYFSALEQRKFARMVDTIYWLFLFLAFFSIPFHILDWVSRKQMLIFSEPSHFAVVFAPFFLYKMFTSRKRFKHLYICLCLSILLQNVTLIMVALLGITVSFKRYGVLQVTGVISLIGIFASFVIYFDDFFAFFLNRIALSADSNNLSVLMFLSGYERAYLTFFETNALGVGFQQMGIIGPLGEYQVVIIEMVKATLNLLDGGSLFSKLTTEFGIFGVFLILAYVVNAIRFFRLSRTLSSGHSRELFYVASFLSLFILIFIRSVNYFSPSSFIALIALIGLLRLNRQRTRYTKEYTWPDD